MSLAVNVLTPAGRRQTVKVTPNTSILQILDDVCRKQGFSANEHELRHHKRVLALSDTVRFSNLPNNAQLELVRSAAEGDDVGKKLESRPITIGLQLCSGERCLADFDADVTLWDILVHWQTNGKNDVLDVPDESGRILEPVCVYMRKEVSGEAELKKASLRSLGLVGGKVIVRLLHRPPNVEVKQAFVESLNLRQPQQLSTQNEIGHYLDEPDRLSEEDNNYFSSAAAVAEMDPDEIFLIEGPSMSVEGSTDDDDNGDKDPILQTTNDIGQSMDTECASTMISVAPIAQINSIVERSECDEDTVESNSSARLVYLDNKGSLLYNLDEVPKPINDELPDQFFEVTMDDVRLLLSDLKRQREDTEDAPLRTSAMRESQFLMRLNRYPKSVIRVHFPDRLVLQGSFKATDKVEKIIDFVRSFLVDPEVEFILYTTPPKRILNCEERLFEIPLVPAAVVHFGCETALDHYLADDVMVKISSPSAVNQVVLCNSDSRETEEHLRSHKVAKDNRPLESTESAPSTSILPSTSSSSSSQGAIPKWFSMGKK